MFINDLSVWRGTIFLWQPSDLVNIYEVFVTWSPREPHPTMKKVCQSRKISNWSKQADQTNN